MTIGQNIKSIRIKQGISQKSLAEKSGVGLASIQRIEYGQLNPKRETLHKIATALHVNDVYLDDHLKEMFQSWDDRIDTESLSKEVQVWDTLPDYDEDDIEIFRQLLSLNPDGKQNVSEYIQDLIPKYKKK